MNNNQFLDNRFDIADWLNSNGVEKYTIEEDLTVNVKGGLKINTQELDYLPVRFAKVDGNVSFHYMYYSTQTRGKLKSLEGCPQIVGGHFNCSYNQLKSLVGGPKEVALNYVCSDNCLISLQGSPEEVIGNFNCEDNILETLKGGPLKVGEKYWCCKNRLVSLKGMGYVGGEVNAQNNQLISLDGAPENIYGSFLMSFNSLTSLVGGPRKVFGQYVCDNNLIDTLEGFPEFVEEQFYCDNNPGLEKFNLNFAKDFRGRYLSDGMVGVTALREKLKLEEELQLNQANPLSKIEQIDNMSKRVNNVSNINNGKGNKGRTNGLTKTSLNKI